GFPWDGRMSAHSGTSFGRFSIGLAVAIAINFLSVRRTDAQGPPGTPFPPVGRDFLISTASDIGFPTPSPGGEPTVAAGFSRGLLAPVLNTLHAPVFSTPWGPVFSVVQHAQEAFEWSRDLGLSWSSGGQPYKDYPVTIQSGGTKVTQISADNVTAFDG